MATKELEPEDITVLIDRREQLPLNLAPLKTEPGTLATGDYSIKGLEHIITVERKSLSDLTACIGVERERFEREMHRILAHPARLLVVEATLDEIASGQYRSKVSPNSVMGSLMGWMAAGIPILFTKTHEETGPLVARFLFVAARRRWREAQGLIPTLKLAR